MSYKFNQTFLKIVHEVVRIEGGYVNDPNDTGGPTKYGIAWNKNADYLKAKFGFKKPEDIKNLTKDQAIECYYDRYYVLSGAEKLTDVDLAFIHFDCAVNQGVGTAKNILNGLSPSPFYFDGSGGKNRLLFLQLFLDYVARRIEQYTRLRKALKTEYLSGWMNRVADTIRTAKELD